jgi:Stage II sporulation protein M
MKTASTGAPTLTSIATGAALCATAITAIVAAAAFFVASAGLSDEARHALGFGFGGVDHTTAEAAWIATHNAKYAAGTLACALLVPWLPRWARLLSDYVLAAMLALNAGTIGVAFGAYRWRAIAATAPHLPVELAGLSLAGGAYLHARRQPLSARALIATTAGCASLLAAAAVIETYVSMGGAR